MTVERFVAGAIGEPGNRVFLLEVDHDGETIAYLIEKIQVAALAREAEKLLRDRGLVGSGLGIDPGDVNATTPVAFRVGGLQLIVDDDAEEATVVLHSSEEGEAPVTYAVNLPQLDAFAREAAVVVAAGRPACPRCGLAMDPDGHSCPRDNGDLRGHRP
jgi:uncharacterized repeat protein (TIGR03847 family)